MAEQLSEEMEELEKNPDVTAIVLTGNKDSFVVGADITEFSNM